MQYMGDTVMPYGSKADPATFAQKLFYREGKKLPPYDALAIVAVLNMQHKQQIEKLLKDMQAGRDITPAQIDNIKAVNDGMFAAYDYTYNGTDYRTRYKTQLANIRAVNDDITAMLSTLTQYDVTTSRKDLTKKIQEAKVLYAEAPKLDYGSILRSPAASDPRPVTVTPSQGYAPASAGYSPHAAAAPAAVAAPVPVKKDSTLLKIGVAAVAGIAAFFALKG